MDQQIDWRAELIDRPPEDCQIISSYGLYVSLIAFWVGFESYKLESSTCPYTLSRDVSAFKNGQEAAARISWLRGRECPSCS